ncbi:hypothetical protein [Thiomicrorhabdus cannonii]|uniref:hypothetical protein n=1 Tax=Thiomicrorhabdus cannonii TaxID=2748011 RepID=UPI0015BC42CA|nr:hypothetical protein [Thiomicrorhabdus cannonii]
MHNFLDNEVESIYATVLPIRQALLADAELNRQDILASNDSKLQAKSKPFITVADGKMSQAVNATIEILKDHQNVFDLGEQLVVIKDLSVQPQNENLLAYWLGENIQFVIEKRVKKETVKEYIDPPVKLVKQLLSLGSQRGLKKLRGVISAPVLRKDGSLLRNPGYDSKTGLFLTEYCVKDFNVPDVLTQKEISCALKEVMFPFKDFTFANDLDKELLLTALLSAIMRPVLATSPGFAIDAPYQASGKTLLATAIASLMYPETESPSVLPYIASKSDDENRKRLFAELLRGVKTIILDNVVGQFDSPALAAAMTSSSLTDRVLGESQTKTLPVNLLFLMTGNNVVLAGDMPRRIPIIRIDPKTPEPYKRRFDFDPVQYVKTNRIKLVAAGLTIVKAWLTSSDYKNGVYSIGSLASFEEWDSLVRQPVAWLAKHNWTWLKHDPMDAFDRAQKSDPEQEALYELLVAVDAIYNGNVFSSRQLVDSVNSSGGSESCTDLHDILVDWTNNKLNSRSIGRLLTYRKDRQVKDLVLRSVTKEGNKMLWRVEKMVTS